MSGSVRLKRWWRRQQRGVLCALLALMYLSAWVGVMPTPAAWTRVAQRVSGERYPCEGGRCSCRSARECWTMCRCHTLAEKVAWAQREGVAIPSYIDLSRLGRETRSQPACPLCAHGGDEGQRAADERDAPLGMPTLSPLGCKGVELMMALSVPPAAWRGGWMMSAPEDGAWGVPERECAPAPGALDAPEPPPRALAA